MGITVMLWILLPIEYYCLMGVAFLHTSNIFMLQFSLNKLQTVKHH